MARLLGLGLGGEWHGRVRAGLLAGGDREWSGHERRKRRADARRLGAALEARPPGARTAHRAREAQLDVSSGRSLPAVERDG
eukprot:4791143-Prymnesium_polylepis.1